MANFFFFTLAPRQEVGERNTSGDGDVGQGGSGRRHTAPAQNVWGGTGGGCGGVEVGVGVGVGGSDGEAGREGGRKLRLMRGAVA